MALVIVQRLPPDLRLIIGRKVKGEWHATNNSSNRMNGIQPAAVLFSYDQGSPASTTARETILLLIVKRYPQ